MSGENVLAQRIAEDNKDLKAQVNQLTETNESLYADLSAYKALGTADEIVEKLKYANSLATAADNINESYQNITEQFGSEDEIVESLTNLNSFTDKHGNLESVDEALGRATTQLQELQDFVESHGSLDQVAITLTRMAGAAEQITENANLAAQAREFQESRGSFDIVESALDKAGDILGSIHESKQLDELRTVAESYGKTPEELKEIMESFNISLDNIDESFAKLGVRKIDETKDKMDENGKECEDDDDDKVDESYNPKRLASLVTGGSYLKGKTRDIQESNESDEISESNKPSVTKTSRLENMVR